MAVTASISLAGKVARQCAMFRRQLPTGRQCNREHWVAGSTVTHQKAKLKEDTGRGYSCGSGLAADLRASLSILNRITAKRSEIEIATSKSRVAGIEMTPSCWRSWQAA